jgi:hypothetical protein
MSELSPARQLRQAKSNSRLHLTAVISVLTGAALLAGGAFLLSYDRIHEMALTAGVSPSLAALYPLMFDAALVIACVAALALRGAKWWMRTYAAFAITILLAAVAVAEAVHSAGISLPYSPTAAAFAAMPWALFLVGFSLGLLVLRYLRTARAIAQPDGVSEEKEPGNIPDTPVLSIFQQEDPGPSQYPVAPDATPAPTSEHHHGQAHWHHHDFGDDHAGSS